MEEQVTSIVFDENARENKVKIVDGVRYELRAIKLTSGSCYIDQCPVEEKKR